MSAEAARCSGVAVHDAAVPGDGLRDPDQGTEPSHPTFGPDPHPLVAPFASIAGSASLAAVTWGLIAC
jgi:hypothetical protein